MPSLSKRSCSTPGCPNTATSGSRCGSCQKQQQKRHDQARPVATARGYDADHQRLRILAFKRDDWTCVDCGWQPESVRECILYDLDFPPVDYLLRELRDAFNRGERHLHADHVIPVAQQQELRLSLDNLATRCNICHASKTMRELRQKL